MKTALSFVTAAVLSVGAAGFLGCDSNSNNTSNRSLQPGQPSADRPLNGGDATLGRAPAGADDNNMKTTPQARQPSFTGDSN